MFFKYNQFGALQWNVADGAELNLSSIASNPSITSPCYIYSQHLLEGHYLELDNLFRSYFKSDDAYTICFSIKCCSNINIVRLLGGLGSGADVVSGGEILRAKAAGIDMQKVVFAGVGKSRAEIELAIKSDILQINAESFEELEFINLVAGELGARARVCLRMNPDIDAKTHSHITTGKKDNKFGIAYEQIITELPSALKKFNNLDLNGFSTHIGSQITEIAPLEEVFFKLANLSNHFTDLGYSIKTIDFGGGLGVQYGSEFVLPAADYASVIFKAFKMLKSKPKLIIEPGRFIAARAGILLAKVLYVKQSSGKKFVVLDAGMNDLIRPALYDAKHLIFNLNNTAGSSGQEVYDVVGPVCESTCCFAKGVRLAKVQQGDVLAITNSGAYGSVMASRYNTRPLLGEYLIDKSLNIKTIRKPETYEQIFANETLTTFDN